MTTTTGDHNDNHLRRIADALERLADRYAPKPTTATHITIGNDYGINKETLARTISEYIRDAVKRGPIPPNRNAA